MFQLLSTHSTLLKKTQIKLDFTHPRCFMTVLLLHKIIDIVFIETIVQNLNL